ncbi:putative RNA helicase [Dioscorea sansibarensis]
MATDAQMELNPMTGRPYSRRYHKLLEKRKKLPIWAHKEKFLDALAKHQIVVVAAGSGSGKSTQIPQFIIEAGYAGKGKKVVCTEPRRLVATAISRRVAQEMDVIIGQEVGYSVLFEDCSGPKTTLKYLTDGMLLRELLVDQFLQSYGVIVLDEAHLRTLATDILLGYLKSLIERNSQPDLKLVIMSTQHEAKWFKDYFKGTKIVQVQGSLCPVEIIHASEPIRDYLEAAIEKVLEILTSEPTGDILVFLPGGDDIEIGSSRLTGLLKDRTNEVGPVRVLPLHSTLSLELQKKIFKAAPPSTRKGGPVGRKVIMSTDIAESSLAIDGIVYVIDSGLSKQKVYSAGLHAESLLVLPISRASAYRRSGCCRRTVPGKCYRLYTNKFLEDCQPHASPEILRANLAGTALLLKKLGISDMLHFDFINPPAVDMMTSAIETLNCLDALDGDGNLTAMGELMSEFPLDPHMSKMILCSPEFKCSTEILSIISMLSGIPFIIWHMLLLFHLDISMLLNMSTFATECFNLAFIIL